MNIDKLILQIVITVLGLFELFLFWAIFEAFRDGSNALAALAFTVPILMAWDHYQKQKIIWNSKEKW